MTLALFFKAAIPGGAAGDLFNQQVNVKGHTTKAGVYVRPHSASRMKHAPEPHPARPKVDMLTAPDAVYFQALYDAAIARLAGGGEFTLGTRTRSTRYSKPEHAAGLRFANGELYAARGRSWDALGKVGEGIDALAHQLGFPTTYARTKHAIDSKTEDDYAAEALARRNQGIELGPLIDAHEAAGDAWRADLDNVDKERAKDAARRALVERAAALGLRGFRLDDVVNEYLEAKGA